MNISDTPEQVSASNIKQDPESSVTEYVCSIEEEGRKSHLTNSNLNTAATLEGILDLIRRTDEKERNFQMENNIAIFDEYRYRLHSSLDNGESLWLCVEKRLRCCSARIIIDASGRRAKSIKYNYHSHSAGPAKLFECPAGKGFTEYHNKQEPFWLLYDENSSSKARTRSIIFQSYRYFLLHFQASGSISIWKCNLCRERKCKATLRIYGLFVRIEDIRLHNHEPLPQQKIDLMLNCIGINSDSTEAIDAFRKNTLPEDSVELRRNLIKDQQLRRDALREEVVEPKRNLNKELSDAIKSVEKEKNPEIFSILSVEDPEREFECLSAGPKMKIKHNDFEYRYFGKQADGSTLWKCVMDSLLHCAVIVRVDESGKRLTNFKGSKHSHGKEPIPLFSYPLGQRMVEGEPIWLLLRYSMYYESRCVIYRDHVYYISDMNRKGVVRWGCIKNQSCRATLVVEGDFETISLRKEHSHEKTPEKILKTFIEGRSQAAKVVEDLPFKQKLLSYPSTMGKIWSESSHQYETFYIIKTLKTGVTVSCVLLFRNFRYILASVDQNGTSTWLCTKLNTEKVCCRANVVVEGLFESICSRKEHIHNPMLDSELEHLIKQNFSEKSLDEPLEQCRGPENGLTEHPKPKGVHNNVLCLLAKPDPDRNFEVTRIKTKLIIRYENEEFRLKCHDSHESSLWCCIWSKIRLCPVVLKLDSKAKHISPMKPTKKHNHTEEQLAVYHLQIGKGQTYDERRRVNSWYWLFTYPSDFRESRGIIYQGHKYSINDIRNNQVSCWKCRVRNCNAHINVQGAFQSLLVKNAHTHGCLSHDKILAITKLSEIDKDLLETAGTSESPIESKNRESLLRASDLLRILSNDDPDRNFNVSIHKDQIKLHQHRYEYYYQASSETHTIWKCIFSALHCCRATLHLDNDCKTANSPPFPKHNHKAELYELFYYPIGHHSTLNGDKEQSFWFLLQPGFLRPCPMVIYDSHKYILVSVTGKGRSSRWRCPLKGCSSRLVVTGLFEMFVKHYTHCHDPMSEQKQAKLIRQYGTHRAKSTTDGADNDDGVISSIKLELEADPMECEEFE